MASSTVPGSQQQAGWFILQYIKGNQHYSCTVLSPLYQESIGHLCNCSILYNEAFSFTLSYVASRPRGERSAWAVRAELAVTRASGVGGDERLAGLPWECNEWGGGKKCLRFCVHKAEAQTSSLKWNRPNNLNSQPGDTQHLNFMAKIHPVVLRYLTRIGKLR